MAGSYLVSQCGVAAPINDIAERWIDQYERVRALTDLNTALEQLPMTDPQFVYTT